MALRGGIPRGWGLTLCLVGALTVALKPKNQFGNSFTSQITCKFTEKLGACKPIPLQKHVLEKHALTLAVKHSCLSGEAAWIHGVQPV